MKPGLNVLVSVPMTLARLLDFRVHAKLLLCCLAGMAVSLLHVPQRSDNQRRAAVMQTLAWISSRNFCDMARRRVKRSSLAQPFWGSSLLRALRQVQNPSLGLGPPAEGALGASAVATFRAPR